MHRLSAGRPAVSLSLVATSRNSADSLARRLRRRPCALTSPTLRTAPGPSCCGTKSITDRADAATVQRARLGRRNRRRAVQGSIVAGFGADRRPGYGSSASRTRRATIAVRAAHGGWLAPSAAASPAAPADESRPAAPSAPPSPAMVARSLVSGTPDGIVGLEGSGTSRTTARRSAARAAPFLRELLALPRGELHDEPASCGALEQRVKRMRQAADRDLFRPDGLRQ